MRKVFQPKRVYSSGVSARHSLTKKWTFRTSRWVGQMDLLCKYYTCVLSFTLMMGRYRCALIHSHRPELLDYDKLDKVRIPSRWYSPSNNTLPAVRPSRKHPSCIWCSSRTSWNSGTLVVYVFACQYIDFLSAIAWSRRSMRFETRWA